MPQAVFHSPFGLFSVVEENGLITRLDWASRRSDPTALLREACRQLDEYFAGERTAFDLPLDFGTGFQEQMRRAMFAIPFGQTRTYGELAKTLGRPAQAIGQACGANPIPIFIPCHRVLAASGLGGFSAPGGVETKIALLKLEGAGGFLL
ncbi:methylated-DNA--[protein]-cysteine S-methyltransferase [Pseudorhodobacter wandonensis]|uniref:methylated-DNA--[protein]-cysteine S-methyltransferase n=1 Tax=Pseudorhodobacter wandonensis TaxID=1120568 RepID=UPI00067DF6C5|nr:methylated-DNA--[protein]-cysteine S-methyltransferase [Pseudorhodobacter wandonensis]